MTKSIEPKFFLGSDVVWVDSPEAGTHGTSGVTSGLPAVGGGSAPAADKATYTIGDLAREFGVTLRALRFYENKGLIAPQRQGVARVYTAADRSRLALILRGKKLGFTLSEIRQMIAAEEGSADVQTLALSREKCLEQIDMLEKQKRGLEEALTELRGVYQSLSQKIVDFDAKGR
jgi:DNA-binding transcriptional MerR regulator